LQSPLLLFSILIFLGSSFFDSGIDPATHVSVFLALCWLVVFVVGLFKFRSRGLWLVIGLPPAAYWPFALFRIAWKCAHRYKSLPLKGHP
jgi:hypothetical protein